MVEGGRAMLAPPWKRVAVCAGVVGVRGIETGWKSDKARDMNYW